MNKDDTKVAFGLKYQLLSTIASVLLAILTAELIGVQRLVRRFLQREKEFQAVELVLILTLSAFMFFFMHYGKRCGRSPRASHLIMFGLGAGLVSGLLAMTFPSLLLSEAAGLFEFVSSWEDIVGFVAMSTVVTFGWLIGVLSALYLTIISRTTGGRRDEADIGAVIPHD